MATTITSINASGKGIDASGNGDVGVGSEVFLTVTTSDPVTIFGGDPDLKLSDGGVAYYISGSGTNTLVFQHSVAPGQSTPDLAVTGGDTNGASIVGSDGYPPSAFGAPTNPPGILQVDTTPPAPTGLSAQTSTGQGAVSPGQIVTFTLSVNENVVVQGTPSLQLNNGAAAIFQAGQSTPTSLVFTYTVAAGQDTSDLQVAGSNPNGGLALNGGSITDIAGNAFPYPIDGDTGIVVDTVAPVVTITTPGGITETALQTVSGTVGSADAGTTVFVYGGTDPTPLAAATVDGNGNWSTDVTLFPGDDPLYAQDTDIAGNIGTSYPIEFELISPPSIAFDPNVTVKGAATVTFTLDVSANAGVANVEVYNGTRDLGSATNNGDGTYSLTHTFASRSPNGTDLYNLNAVVTDANGGTASVTSPYDLTVGGNFAATVPQTFVGTPPTYSSVQYDFDDQGTIDGETFFKKNGQILDQAVIVDKPDGSQTTTFVNGSFFNGKPYDYFSDTVSTGGDLLQETIGNDDGTNTITAYASGQTLQSLSNDTFTSLGSNEHYVFTSGFGQETITNFHTSGAGYDSISLSKADLPSRNIQQLAQIIGKIQDNAGGLTVPLAHGDSITLLGVTKADLVAEYQQHPKAFKLTA